MLNQTIPKLGYPLILIGTRYHFGVGKLILHYIRSTMNRVRWEENRGFT